jgi:hypothetical protein
MHVRLKRMTAIVDRMALLSLALDMSLGAQKTSMTNSNHRPLYR